MSSPSLSPGRRRVSRRTRLAAVSLTATLLTGAAIAGAAATQAASGGALDQAAVAADLPIGQARSFHVVTPGYTDRSLRHRDGGARTDVVTAASDEALRRDATFTVRAGLADGACFSLESVNFPGHFLRHRNYRIHKDANDNSALFARDATFCARPGRAGSGVSLESLNFPGHFLRHRNSEVWLEQGSGSGFDADATWSSAEPWAGSTPAPGSTPVAANGQLKIVGTQVQNQHGKAVQLRGMSTHGIQWYWNCVNNASLDALAKDWKADVLRISMYVQEGGYETDPAGFTAKVNQAIQMVSDRGMYAVVDFHQLSPGDPNYNTANAKRFFTDIANANKNRNNIIYEIANEPNNVSWARIRDYAHEVIPVIRAIDGDAPILVGTHGWGSLGISDGRSEWDVINNKVNATNIAYTFHFYAGSHGDQYLNALANAANHLPMWVSEFGTQTASGDGANDFTQSQRYIDLMKNRKISWTNWNYSDDHRSGAVWNSGACNSGNFSSSNLKEAGRWIRERIASPDDF